MASWCGDNGTLNPGVMRPGIVVHSVEKVGKHMFAEIPSLFGLQRKQHLCLFKGSTPTTYVLKDFTLGKYF